MQILQHYSLPPPSLPTLLCLALSLTPPSSPSRVRVFSYRGVAGLLYHHNPLLLHRERRRRRGAELIVKLFFSSHQSR